MASVLLEEQIPTFRFAFPRYCLQKTYHIVKPQKKRQWKNTREELVLWYNNWTMFLKQFIQWATTRESSRFPPNSLSIPLK
jgi:hypothetical protein